MNLGTILEDGGRPGRWSGVEGLVFGNLAALFLAPWTSLPFAAWYRIRSRHLAHSHQRYWAPLIAGLSHPFLIMVTVLPPLWVIDRLIGIRNLGPKQGEAVSFILGLFVLIAIPGFLAEVSLRFERPPAHPADRLRKTSAKESWPAEL